ncbi:hypothetical protein KCU99_g2980, partial [Aureobasidium melanogenum]
MTFYNEHEEEPPCSPRKHVLGDRTEFKGKLYTPPAPKPKVNYEEAFKLEGDTFRRKANDPRFEDVEPPQIKGETAKPPFWMKWEMPKVEKKETVKAHPWMK